MNNKEAIAIVNEFVRRHETQGNRGFVFPEGFIEAIKIVNELAWQYEDMCE